MRISGVATVFGDDIDTDVIFPARYLAVLDPVEQGKHLFEPLGPDVRERVARGGVVVGGWNFGCGSSREHAVTAMIGANVRLVVASSFSRIFFRNAINNGLAVVMCPEISPGVVDGVTIEADLARGTLQAGERTLQFAPLPVELLRILQAGGLWAARLGASAQGA
jgi:3-isopropylmalate dehydratase small subunit